MMIIRKLQIILPGPWEVNPDESDRIEEEYEGNEEYYLKGEKSIISVIQYGDKWDATVIGLDHLNCQLDSILCDTPEEALQSLLQRIRDVGELLSPIY